MASIQTGIELNDQFTGVIYNIINAVNLTVSTMEDMQHTMNADMDTSGIEGVRDEINQATMAMNELNAAMQNQPVINSDPFVTPQPPEPVEAPFVPEQSRSPPDPVEIPVTWNTDGLDVFTGSGLERFQQEAASANQMLEQLSATQDAIAKQAYNTTIFPPEAFQDLNSMAVRIDMIRDRVQQITNNPVNMGTDEANAELEHLRGQLDDMIQTQNRLNQAMDNMDVADANAEYLRLSQTVSQTERNIRDNVNAQGAFNTEIQEGAAQADNLMNSIKGMVAAYATIQTVQNVLNISDELTTTTARLDMMNDGVRSTDELVKMVYASAQDARGKFSQMADVVARFGNNAKDAFSSTEEVIAFSNLIQKQMTIAGASTEEANAALLQLSQGLGSGVLRGEELNSVFEQAPNIIQSIADYLEVPIGEIRDMAAEGELTAGVVKAAIFTAADDINAKFESMPMTWGQLWTSFTNTAMMAFQPVLQRLNDMANSEAFQAFVNSAVQALATFANIGLTVFDLLAMGATFVSDNWSIIEPIILGIATAFGIYTAALVAYNTVQAISNGLKALAAFRESVHAAATMMSTGATFAQTVAQYGLNAALAACPLTWIILLIITLIALFYAAVAAVNKFAGTSVSATGIICGAFMVAAAFIGNLFVTLINFVIDIFVVLWNFIAAFANFFGNAFNDPVGSIARLFFDLVDTNLSLLQTLASAIDTIFGSDLAGAVQGWRDSLGGWVDSTFGQGEEIMAKLSSEGLHLDRFEYSGAWDAGYSFGEGIDESIANFNLSDIFGATDIPSVEDYTSGFSGISGLGSDVGSIADNTGAIADSMDITEEELKYMRDIAEQEAVNRYTTAEISVDMSGMQNNINNNDDIDGFVSKLTDSVNEAVDNMTEGVHK